MVSDDPPVPKELVDACTKVLKNGLPLDGMYLLLEDMEKFGDRPLFWLYRDYHRYK